MVYKYVIHDIPPSNNKYIGRNERFRYQAAKEQWEAMVRYECSPKPAKPIKRSRVTLMYYFKTRGRRDPDNYSGKFILDGLRKAGIIEDDSFDNIDLVLKKGGCDKFNQRTVITVEVIEE